MKREGKSQPERETPPGEQSRPSGPAGETEWLRIMLEEIGRKQAELEEEEREQLHRDGE